MKTVIIRKNKIRKSDNMQKIIQFPSRYTWKRISAIILKMKNRNTMKNMMTSKITNKMKKLLSRIDKI